VAVGASDNGMATRFDAASSILSGKSAVSFNDYQSGTWEEFSVSEPKKDLSSLDRSLHSTDAPRVRPIAEAPVYVEKATSFSSKLPPADLFDKITVALDTHSVDYEYQHLKNKIKGICYPNNIPCTFHVNIFSSPQQSGEYLVEFQRRSGCVIAFSQFFGRLVSDSFNSILCGNKPKAPVAPPADLDTEADVKLDDNAVQSLFEMIQSSNVDVQRQGLQTLFNVAIDDNNKKVLLHSPISKYVQAASSSSSSVTLFDVLKELLYSKDSAVVHYAAMILNAFSSSDMCKALLSRPLLDSMFDILNTTWALQSLSMRATKRSLAQTISSLSKTHAQELMMFNGSNNRYVETLERYSCCSDVSMRKYCAQSLDELLSHPFNPSLFL